MTERENFRDRDSYKRLQKAFHAIWTKRAIDDYNKDIEKPMWRELDRAIENAIDDALHFELKRE